MIDELCSKLSRECSCTQNKEKLGTMRFYAFGTDEDYSIIDLYEQKSAKICEVCGGLGKLCMKRHWLKTLCNEHATVYGYKY